MIKVGDSIPAVTLTEFVEVEGNGCSIGPNPVDVAKASAGKTIALFALPGAFTPTCSAKHVPGYVAQFDALKAAGVDEIWCVRPAFRRLGLGRQLAESILDAARQCDYSCVLLDTLDEMETARALYEDLGFEEVAPYYHNPLAGAHYLRVML